MEIDFLETWLLTEREIRRHMSGLVKTEPYRGTCQKQNNVFAR